MSDTMTAVAAPTVSLTPAALQQVRFLVGKQGKPALALRIGVKGGGCSGLSYVMRLEEAGTEKDFVLEQEGQTILIDRKSAQFIDGLQVDYSVKNLLEGGWRYSNPNAERSCGCGTSFTPK